VDDGVDGACEELPVALGCPPLLLGVVDGPVD
jgi:hypothetical protein